MTDTETINAILHPDVLSCPDEDGNPHHLQIRLLERIAGYSVTIHKVPSDLIAIKSDAFPNREGFLLEGVGLRGRADFILVSEKQKVAVFIEMKGGSKKGIIKPQLRGAYCVFRHCQDIGRFLKMENSFLEGYENYFISLKKINAKRPTRHSYGRGGPAAVEELSIGLDKYRLRTFTQRSVFCFEEFIEK